MQNQQLRKVVIAVLGVPIAAAAAWLTGAVAKYGLNVDKSGVAAVMASAVAGVLILAVKLIHSLERELERRHILTAEQVSKGEAAAIGEAKRDVAEIDPSLAAELGWPDQPTTGFTYGDPTAQQPPPQTAQPAPVFVPPPFKMK